MYFKASIEMGWGKRSAVLSAGCFESLPKEKPHTEDPMCALSNPHLSLPPDLAPY